MNVPNFDPVALSLGPLQIRWYSLAYIAGILFVMFWLKKENNREEFLSKKAYDDWVMWAVGSVLIGGRLGYVLFYNFSYFLHHPLEIFAFWNGGMSFHGGLLGCILGSYLFCKKYDVNFLRFGDVMCTSAPIALMFGRLANFVNLELYGRITHSDFGFIFPGGGDLPRHPSQLYEALFEGLILFLLLYCLSKTKKAREQKGFLSGVFLIGYGMFRFLIENFRQPDEHIGFIFSEVTTGQLLSLPLIFAGVILVFGVKNLKKILD
ncbi:MAG: prolipoprotein diacylglyceryl transferase [Rickettsiales bacterium]|nr:prolipoprotein diacylglyceryl transferase [Rickettsiales bacterium]